MSESAVPLERIYKTPKIHELEIALIDNAMKVFDPVRLLVFNAVIWDQYHYPRFQEDLDQSNQIQQNGGPLFSLFHLKQTVLIRFDVSKLNRNRFNLLGPCSNNNLFFLTKQYLFEF